MNGNRVVRKISRRKSGLYTVIGGMVVFLLGVVLSTVNYNSAVNNGSSSYTAYWGAMLVGLILVIRGIYMAVTPNRVPRVRSARPR